MRFILIAISLFFASNTYAVIDTEDYIYSNDSNELKALKEEIKINEIKLAETNLKAIQKNRKDNLNGFDKSEVVYKVGDISKKDVGAKIGMTKDQVINKSYWGKPSSISTSIDAYGKTELWRYRKYGISYSGAGMLIFQNGKLTHIIR